jgi:ABC-type multidrug transport system fused ATPase/permease subunit
LAFTFLVAIALAMRRIGHIQLENSRRFTIAMSELSQVIYESLRGMKHIRLSNSEKTAYRNFSSKFDNLLSTQLKLTAINALSNPVFLASGGVLIAVLIYAGSTWFSGEAESWTSDLLLFLLVLYRMMGPASSLSAGRLSYLSLRDALDHFTRHERLFRENEQSIGTQTISNLSSGIEFDSVSFSYSTEEGGVLHDISVKIPANKMTAIVGPSGAGKSTIVGLIARLFDPTSGRVTVEGIDLRDVDLHSWRSMMAIVSQDTFLYNDTVANNLRFACPGASDAQLQDACRLAAADEFIMAFPNGYDTKIGESGVRLSGGQQQRLSIARAFLRNPVLLILDEATSSLDSRTETAIQRAMEHWSSRSTMVVIAHRLSTIQRADQILVLDEGRLVERGTHQELIELGGDYWDMVSHQRLDLVDAFVQAPMPNRKEE